MFTPHLTTGSELGYNIGIFTLLAQKVKESKFQTTLRNWWCSPKRQKTEKKNTVRNSTLHGNIKMQITALNTSAEKHQIKNHCGSAPMIKTRMVTQQPFPQRCFVL